jgi:hypothetical protein
MANSIAIANVEIQLQDGLQSSIPPVIFRTIPQVMFPSNVTVAYNGYTQLNRGAVENIIGPNTTGPYWPFVYLRNAGSSGIIAASIEWDSSLGIVTVPILPGGVFLYANNLALPNQLFIQTLAITPQALTTAQGGITAEWLVAR